LLVNVLGSFLVGYVLTWSTNHSSDRWRLFAATGFCGALTTFSAFSYESMAYWREGKPLQFALNLLLNNVLCMVAVAFGIYWHQKSA
jgi:CrcB protein